MILNNTSDFKKLKSATLRKLEKHHLPLKWMQTGTLISRSQGFKHEHNFKQGFPIYIETELADDLFRKELALLIEDSSKQPFIDLFSFSKVIEENFSFPFIAGYEQTVSIEIFMEKGFISNPFITHASDRGYQDGTIKYLLGSFVSQDFYHALVKEIQPLVERIKHGFEYYEGSRYSLSDDAKEAQEELSDVVESLIRDNYYDSPDETSVGAYELFNEEIPLLEDIVEEELTEIILNSKILISHETTNLDIRQLVGKYYIEDFMNQDELYDELIEYRDACKKNYLKTL